MGNNFWEFKNSSDSDAELKLYGQISSSRPWWDDSEMIVQSEFIKELNKLNGKNLTLRINSVGGDVWAAHAILTNLKLYKEQHNAKITAQIDGLAASAATIIMTAGDVIKAPSYASIMIHDPKTLLYGWYDGEDLQKALNAWESIKDSIINAYALRFNMTKEEISDIMKAETWMTGQQAKEKNIVDELMFQEDDAFGNIAVSNNNRFVFVNSVVHDLSIFKTKPVIDNQSNSQPPAIPAPAENQNKPEKGGEELMFKTVDELRNACPDLVKQIEDSAREEGVNGERQRLQTIDDIAKNIDQDLVVKAKYGEPMSAEKLAIEALKADNKKGQNYLNQAQQDASASGVANVAGAPTEQQTQAKAEAEKTQAVDSIAAGANQRRGR